MFEKIDERHLKVELSAYDLSQMNVTRSSFALRDENAARALRAILRAAHAQTGFAIFRRTLTVEIFPTVSDGCLILFSENSPKRFKARVISRPHIYRFSHINHLLDFYSAVLLGASSHSDVYFFQEGYYLCFPRDFVFTKSVLRALCEFFGVPQKISPLFLKEHGEKVY